VPESPTPAPDRAFTGIRWRLYHWLAPVPTVILLAGIPFVNRVHPMILGLPLLIAWILLWVVVTSGVMGVVLYLDRARARDQDGR
jgi:Protein of unknown function (DUF3311)